jgi:hypothetical protein
MEAAAVAATTAALPPPLPQYFFAFLFLVRVCIGKGGMRAAMLDRSLACCAALKV